MSAISILDRAAINRSNAQHSTGPRTPEGKARSSQNALRHGLSSRTALISSEDQQAYAGHCSKFFDEYRPATPTETQLTQELADTAWRLNRIPALEAQLLHRAANPPNEEAAIAFDLVDAHRALATLSLHSARLSRQFQRALEQLRQVQSERLARRERDLKNAASISEVHKHQGIPYDPAEDGFVFSREEIDFFARRQMRIDTSRAFDYSRTYEARKLFGAMVAGK